MRFLITTPLFIALFLAPLAVAQEPIPPSAPVSPQAPAPATAPQPAPAQESTSKHKSKIPPFLILGTVFNEHALAFPGVEIKIRPTGERKFRLYANTNSRGEFAIRVPDGLEYEVVVRAKNYREQTQVVLANRTDVQKRLSFKLERTKPAKAGDSK